MNRPLRLLQSIGIVTCLMFTCQQCEKTTKVSVLTSPDRLTQYPEYYTEESSAQIVAVEVLAFYSAQVYDVLLSNNDTLRVKAKDALDMRNRNYLFGHMARRRIESATPEWIFVED